MKASDFYHGVEKYNCAQAVLRAFRDKYNLTCDFIELHKKSGSGRADGGLCGAIYAVHLLIKDKNKIDAAEKIFSEKAGSTRCKEIRNLKMLECAGCVDLAEKILYLLDRQ